MRTASTGDPAADHQRVTDLVEATGLPMALHGGTGLSPEEFRDLIARGCAKVNISTALKEAYMRSGLEHLKPSEATKSGTRRRCSPTSATP